MPEKVENALAFEVGGVEQGGRRFRSSGRHRCQY
jgi:hypothetical protein